MEDRPFKRSSDDPQNGPRKTAKSGDAGMKKMSFAERMMAKMGHVEGQGLGKDAQGIAEPISVKQRPSKVGIGVVRELSEQQIREKRRIVEQNGGVYVDSDEEEHKAERTRRKIKKGLSGSGSSTPGGRPKQKYLVAEAEAEGLHVPSTLKSLLDMTGAQKQITDASGIRLGHVPAEKEETILARKYQRDLEAYASAYHDLAEESKTITSQEEQLSRDLAALELDINTAKSKTEVVRQLLKLNSLEEVVTALEAMPSEYRDEDIIIAAAHPKVRLAVSDWHPLDPVASKVFISTLTRLKNMLESNNALILQSGEINKPRKRATTPYESMVQILIQPKLREAILAWSPQAPYEMCALAKSMEPCLPRYLLNSTHKEISTKLERALHDFNPRLALKKKRPLLHSWVVPMLEVLPEKLTGGLLDEARRKVRACLEIWPLQPLPGLKLWRQVFGPADFNKLMVNTMIPRLSTLLRANFLVDPTDQKLDTLDEFLSWTPFIKREHMAELVQVIIVPQILSVLHQWLEGEPNYDEIGQWYMWWKGVLPQQLNDLNQVAEMINRSIDGNLEAFGEDKEQPAPAPEAARPVDTPSKEPPRRKEVGEAMLSFKDIVEEWCGEENLLLIPLREAHGTTGLPLFRITANAVGRGGVVVYMKGDVLYAAEKKDKSVWRPIGLGSELVDKAEGK